MFNSEDANGTNMEENILRGLKLKKIKCPICQNKIWELMGNVEAIYEFNHEKKQSQRHGCIKLPKELVKLECKNCGYISEFNIEPLIKAAEDESKEYSGGFNGLKGDENAPLDDIQKRFVMEYIKDRNKEQAAIRAGYQKQIAAAVGNNLMCSRKIIKAVKEQTEKLLDD